MKIDIIQPAHERLGLTKEVLDALLWVRDALDSGKLRHERDGGDFNMRHWLRVCSDCGTACCIGGWIEIHTETEFSHHSDTERLQDLFFPGYASDDTYDLRVITPQQAVRAIDNFIATGDPNWRLATQRR